MRYTNTWDKLLFDVIWTFGKKPIKLNRFTKQLFTYSLGKTRL